MRPRLSPLLRPDVRFCYIGREEAASPATGSYKIHQAEEQAILERGAGTLTGWHADVRVPPLGESVSEGVIVRWLKDDGALVRADEPLLELETDKATLEIPAEPRAACTSPSRSALASPSVPWSDASRRRRRPTGACAAGRVAGARVARAGHRHRQRPDARCRAKRRRRPRTDPRRR